jgi:alpha-1,2-mannosyltransferase
MTPGRTVLARMGAGRAGWLAAGVAVALASTSLWASLVYHNQLRLWSMIDLQILEWGGHLALDDPAILYDARFWGYLPFFYPPLSAFGFAVLTHLPFALLKVLTAVTIIASVFAVIWLTLGLAARRRGATLPGPTRLAATGLLGGGVLWLEPVQQTLAFGQLSAVLLFMVVADLAIDDRRWYKGVLIGLGTGVKLYPGVFIVYLLLTGRVRAALVACGALLTTVAAGVVLLPGPSARFWTPVGLATLNARVDAWHFMNQSVNAYILRVTAASAAGFRQGSWTDLVIMAVGLALAVAVYRRHGEPGGMLTAALTSLLASPISWSHYWVWVVPALTWLAYETWVRRSRWGVAALALVVALFLAYPVRVDPITDEMGGDQPLLPMGILWTVPKAGQVEFTWTPWQQVVGNAYIIFGALLLLLVAGWMAATTWGPGSRARVPAAAGRPGR